jgi:hypothetical protein
LERRLLQRVAVRLQLHLDIAARRLRVGANGVRFGDERLGLRLVDAVQLGVQRHIQEKPAFVLWAEIIRGLDKPATGRGSLSGQTLFIPQPAPSAGFTAIRAAGVALPPTLRELQ